MFSGGIEKDPGMKWVNRYDDGKQLYNVKILMKTITRKWSDNHDKGNKSNNSHEMHNFNKIYHKMQVHTSSKILSPKTNPSKSTCKNVKITNNIISERVFKIKVSPMGVFVLRVFIQ